MRVDRGRRPHGDDEKGTSDVHGRSDQVRSGNDMDHGVADLAALTEHPDLRDAVHIGRCTGGGEVAR
jgi:hypothetical protein